MASERERIYIEDIDKKNLSPAKLIRAERLVGDIISINIPSEVLRTPNFFIAGAKDIPGSKTIDVDGDLIPLFASSKIEYPGQPVFIATHPDSKMLNYLCSRIEIVVKGAPLFLLTTQIPDPKILQKQLYKEKIVINQKKKLESLFEEAEKIIDKTYKTGPQEHFSSGCQGVIIENTKEGIQITTSTEWINLVKKNTANVLKLEEEKIHVQATKKSPSFYGKLWYPALLAAQLSVLARKSKKSLQLLLTKKDEILYTTKRAPMLIHKSSAFNSQKELVAEKTEILIDGGAFPVFSYIMEETVLAGAQNIYKKIPSQIIIKIIRTSNPTMDFLSGTALAPILFAVERHEDQIAAFLGLTSMEWRIQHLSSVPQGKEITKLLLSVAQKVDYNRKQSIHQFNQNSPHTLKTIQAVKGVGIACGFQGNGIIHKDYPNPQYNIRIHMKNEDSLDFYTSTIPSSNKTINIWKKDLSESFNINPKGINIINTSSDTSLNGGPPFLYNRLFSNHLLIQQAAKQLKSQRRAKQFPIELELSMEETQQTTKDLPPFRTITCGAVTVEVKINPISNEIEPQKINIAINCGKLQNRKYAIQRIKIALEQSLHWILTDQSLEQFNKHIDFTLPPLMHLPKIDIQLNEKEEIHPKGIVELIFNIVPAAFAAATSQALNKQVQELPISLKNMEGDS